MGPHIIFAVAVFCQDGGAFSAEADAIFGPSVDKLAYGDDISGVWRGFSSIVGIVGKNLLNWQRSLPENTDRSPEAFLFHTNETESLEGHRLWIVVQVGVHELVGWDPLGEGASVLPHVEVVLSLLSGRLVSFLGAGGVHVASIEEGIA